MRLTRKLLTQAKCDVSNPMSIDVKARENGPDAEQYEPRRVNLPFSEADLLKGLDAYGTHADELAQQSITDMGS